MIGMKVIYDFDSIKVNHDTATENDTTNKSENISRKGNLTKGRSDYNSYRVNRNVTD